MTDRDYRSGYAAARGMALGLRGRHADKEYAQIIRDWADQLGRATCWDRWEEGRRDYAAHLARELSDPS